MTVRAKFKCVSITRTKSGTEEMQTIALSPVTGGSEENKSFWKWTPSGRIELGTINKEAGDSFELDKTYYIDFTPAE